MKQRISSAELRARIGLHPIIFYIYCRQLYWLGNASRMDFFRLTRRMLLAGLLANDQLEDRGLLMGKQSKQLYNNSVLLKGIQVLPRMSLLRNVPFGGLLFLLVPFTMAFLDPTQEHLLRAQTACYKISQTRVYRTVSLGNSRSALPYRVWTLDIRILLSPKPGFGENTL